MKKLMVVVALLITVLCFSSMASAREVNYKVDYDFNNTVFSSGETVCATVRVKKLEESKKLESDYKYWNTLNEYYEKAYVEFNSEIKGTVLSYNGPFYNDKDYVEYKLMFKAPKTTGTYNISISSRKLSGNCTITVKVLNKTAPAIKYTFKNKTLKLKFNVDSNYYHKYELQYKYNNGKWCNYEFVDGSKCTIADSDWLGGWEKGTYKFRVRHVHYDNYYAKPIATNWSKPITIKVK